MNKEAPESKIHLTFSERIVKGEFPGFVEMQINGAFGTDLQHPDLTPFQVIDFIKKLSEQGVTTIYPTVITNSLEAMKITLAKIAEAIGDSSVKPYAGGIHLEGPWISDKDGPRGAHPKEHVKSPKWKDFEELQKAANGLISIVTLAPEKEGAKNFIEDLVEAGIIVGIGHHAASEDQINEAAAAGAKFCTHLGNGAHPELPRHRDNYIWIQMAHDGLMASVIADGEHLPPYALQNILRAKGPERVILVSDAMAGVGMGPGIYTLGVNTIEVGSDGIARLPGSQNLLAGSTLDMRRAVENAVRLGGVNFSQALDMAYTNLLRLLGRKPPESRVLFEWHPKENQLKISDVIFAG